MFQNRRLRRIFGLKRDEMTGGWRKVHNENTHKLCSSTGVNIMTKRMHEQMGEMCRARGEVTNTHKSLIGVSG
jgi:hypothetical protein